MINELNNMSDKDREYFGKCIQKLLSRTFVIEKLYHREKRVVRNPIYSFIEEHESLFSEYLKFGGFELECDLNNGVYYISNSLSENNVIFSKVTTIFLLVIRLIYEEKQESITIGNFITFTMDELLRKIEVLNLNTGLISDLKIKQGMRELSKYNLVEKIKGEYSDTSSMYIIYPSIIKCVDSNVVITILNEFEKINEADVLEGDEEA